MQPFISEFPQLWLEQLTPTLSRYVMFAVTVWFTLWIALAGLLAARKIRADRPPVRQLATEFFFSIRSMAIFALGGVCITYMIEAGLYPMPARAEAWGALWFAASLAVTIIVHDAYFYWTHRLMHDPRFFRRLHRRHHRSHNPSPFTAYSFDVGEAALMVAFFILWPLIFPIPWAGQGAFMLFQIVRNTILHSGYELRPMRPDGRPWLDFMTTTTHHDLHHGEAGYNYGAWFTWWDRWMGTEHPEYLARYAEKAWRPAFPTTWPGRGRPV